MGSEHHQTEVILNANPIAEEGDGVSADGISDDDAKISMEEIKELAAMRSILDQQSIIQFRQFAQEQHPKDPIKQHELVDQMQEQHFQYYIDNVHQSQLANQQRQIEQLLNIRNAARSNTDSGEITENAEGDDMSDDPIPLPLVPASVWTRKDIVQFKKDILANQRDCCIKISSLASATLRVPTHGEGTSIFWEFATDGYDLGFGLFFEWSLTPPENITMTISESSDEEGEDEDEEEANENAEKDPSLRQGANDIEVGGRGRRRRGVGSGDETVPPTDELIPVYRRDCHSEVYCGSHQYPGCGVYVFKFDNSFSLWRSKWLYYRVFYGK